MDTRRNGYPPNRAGSPSLPLPATAHGHRASESTSTSSRNGKQAPQGMKQDGVGGTNEDSDEDDGDDDEDEDGAGLHVISQAFGRNIVGGNEYGALPMGNLKPVKQGPTMLSDDLKPGALLPKPASEPSRGGDRGGSGRTTPQPQANISETAKGDLTNTKLARNQQVLMDEIEMLRSVTERQGKMMERMMSLLVEMGNSKGSVPSKDDDQTD